MRPQQPGNQASGAAPPAPRGRWDWLHRRPLLACAVCFLLGILAVEHHLLGMIDAAAICLVMGLAAILASRTQPSLSSAALLLAFMMLGGFLHSIRMIVPESDISHLAGPSPVTIEGTVASAPETWGHRTWFSLRALTVDGVPVTGLAQVWTRPTQVAAGDGVRLVDAVVSAPDGARRPGQFDPARWLRRRGITAEVESDAVEVVGDVATRGPGIMARAVTAIEDAMPGHDADLYAHLLVGMVYGLEAQPLPETVVDDFRRAGTVHLLVVSGAQVSMLVIAVLWLAGVRWPSARWWHLVPVGLALLVLVLIVGMGESVARAVAMFALLAAAGLTWRDFDIATAIGFAAFVICLFDTNALFSLGFQLTFAATIGVVLFLPPEPLRMINRSPAPRSVQGLRVAAWGTVGAWLMTTPLLAHSFGGFPFLGNIANLVNVPISGVVMVLGFIALPLAVLASWTSFFLWTWPLQVLCALARLLLDVTMGVNWLAGSLPLAYVDGIRLSVVGCILWYALVALLALGGSLDRARAHLDRPLARMHPSWVPIGGAAAVAVIWLSHALAALPPSALEVSFLPVGAGQCAVVRAPSGASMMIDCGGRAMPADTGDRLAAEVVRPWLSRHGVRRLDLLAVSHWDADHYNALAWVLPGMRLGTALLPPELPESRQPEELDLLLSGRSTRALAGGAVSLGGGASASVLSPRRPWLTSTRDDANNNSLVLRVALGERAILLTGDMQAAGIERLARDCAAGRCDLRADVVCLPHHGRGLEQSLRLLDLARPRWAVASCDHQADDYLGTRGEEMLEERGIRLLRTDRTGAITFATDGRTLRMRTSSG